MKSLLKSVLTISCLLFIFIGCKKEEASKEEAKVVTPLALTTASIAIISFDSISTGGNITDDGGSAIIERGVCWSQNALPSYFDNRSSDGIGSGPFTTIVTGLNAGNTYYVRAYAINANDTAYGNQLSFTTSFLPILLSTNSALNITSSTATCGGNITSDGGSSITSRGVCWSLSTNPTITDPHVISGNGTGSYSCNLTGLNPSTNYFVRAYAINANDTAYGSSKSFITTAATTSGCGGQTTVTDIDGNVYNVITIGGQCWMKENLKTANYKNGTSIPTGLSNANWTTATTGAYAIYNNDSANDSIYGKLYNYYAVVDPAGLCPTSWHVPTESEWNIMAKYLEPSADTTCMWCTQSATLGGKLKSTGITLWNSPNGSASNSSSFTGLPAGERSYNGNYLFLHMDGYYWNSSSFGPGSGYSRQLYYNDGSLQKYDAIKAYGFSVRCVKD